MDSPREIKTLRGTILELPLPEHVNAALVSATASPERIDAITCSPVDFSQTTLPVYTPFFAVLLDNVFSPEECALIRAVPDGHWNPLVQGDAFREVDRTLVLNEQIAAVLYARIQPHLERLGVTRLRKPAAVVAAATVGRSGDQPYSPPQQQQEKQDWSEGIAGASNIKGNQGRRKATWEMYACNERLTFLRYGVGMHHDRHCDQIFSRPGMGKEYKSFLTCQVYLSDAPGSSCVEGDAATADGGGTTRFWGPPGTDDEQRYVDVVPKAGRVLVFQQRMLWHSGQPVTAGLKYAMRTDLMYRRSFT